MRKVFIAFSIYFLSFFSHAYANSYFDMITQPPEEFVAPAPTPPENDSPLRNSENYYPLVNTNPNQPTSAPVITPTQEQEKYQAWLKAQQQPADNTALNKENIQNLIYTIEIGLLGAGLYEIYRYK